MPQMKFGALAFDFKYFSLMYFFSLYPEIQSTKDAKSLGNPSQILSVLEKNHVMQLLL